MPRFGETQAANTQFTGRYDVAGWVKASQLKYKTFHIDGCDFRTSSKFGKDEEEYVMMIRFENPEDELEIAIGDGEQSVGSEWGVSGRHYRIMAQLRDLGENDFPVEFVTIVEEDVGKGNPALMLADPSTLNPDTGISTTSQPATTGATGGSQRTNTGAQTNAKSGNRSTSTQPPIGGQRGGSRR